MSQFAHLRVHTEYSIADSIVAIKPLIQHAVADQQPAIAITDRHNLFGSVKFYRQALNAGIKPIIGAEVMVQQGDLFTLLTLYCQNEVGYHNLTALLSRCHLEQDSLHGVRAKPEWLTQHHEGLIVLLCSPSDVQRALEKKQSDQAAHCLQQWHNLYPGRLYLELKRLGSTHENTLNAQLIELANQLKIPLIANNDVRFIQKEDFEAHEVKVCVQSNHILNDPKRPKWYQESQYLKSQAEMQSLFAHIPAAIKNTIELAKRCNFQFSLGEVHLPIFPVAAQHTPDSYCRELVESALEQHLQTINANQAQQQQYRERLNFEMDIICKMGFSSYFLIVADFIQWAKDNGIPVGPGRGSGAGSLVAFMLRITGLDPLPHELLFERFLNPERVSMPDFDIDFCMEGRDRVIAYVSEKYGQECVSQIITYGTMAAKAVIRDVGRVMGHSYGFVDQIAKLVPFEVGMTLTKALEDEPSLKERYEEEEHVKTLIDMGLKLEGIARNAGKHAGGVIIAPRSLTTFTALYTDPDNHSPVTHLDKNDIEDIGLIKFDFLGLRTLTIINWAVQRINNGEELINIDTIPLDDAATFKLLKKCETTAVFQLESRGMKDLVKRLEPDSFEEIVALVALFRPGPLQSGMVDDYINRKHGRAKIDCMHPLLQAILEPTYGIILYQEQVMKIAQVLSNYSLGSADLLRRAMGKKKPEEMAKQRQIFIDGAVANQIAEKKAADIFDIIEKFAGYGFNKSHSAAYALIAYQTAYLKTHYPSEYMAAVLSADMDHSDKVAIMIAECRRMKIELLAPDINKSDYQFTVHGAAIQFSLGAIKGVGEAAIESIIAERQQHGPFRSLFDFCQRTNKQKINRRVIESLVKAGAMDGIHHNRALLLHNIDKALKSAEQQQRDQHMGQSDLFGQDEACQIDYHDCAPWAPLVQLQFEKQTLGFYFKDHPMRYYGPELPGKMITSLHRIKPPMGESESTLTVGIIGSVRTIFTKRGDKMAVLTLQNEHLEMDVTIFSDLFSSHKNLVQTDQLLVVSGTVSRDSFTDGIKIVAKEIWGLDQFRRQFAKRLHITISHHHSELLEKVMRKLPEKKAQACPVQITLKLPHSKASFTTNKSWETQPTHIKRQLNELHAAINAEYEF